MKISQKIQLVIIFVFSFVISFSLVAAKEVTPQNQAHSATVQTTTHQATNAGTVQNHAAPDSRAAQEYGKTVKTATQQAAADAHATDHAHADHAADGKFDVTGTILHHIADANNFHIGGNLTIPLPCIIYNLTHGKLDFFMSNKFGHLHHGDGTQIYKAGSQLEYKMVADRVKPVDNSTIIDFSITKNVFGMLLASVILFLVFFSVAKACKTNAGAKPRGLQNAIEPFVGFVVNDIAKPNIGAKYKPFVPYLCTVFFFILVLNLLGLIPIFPGSANVTGNIAVTLVLSVITFIVTNLNGTKDYWMHILNPPVPLALKPILIPLELIGIFTKPFALMVRLFANITAGHIIILSLISLIFIFGKMGASTLGVAGGVGMAVPFVLFMNCIELLVAFLQAYIFTMLTALFIGLAVEEHEHHH